MWVRMLYLIFVRLTDVFDGEHDAMAAQRVRRSARVPGIELHLIEAHPRVALDLLRAGQVDVAVVFRYDDTTPDDVRAMHPPDPPRPRPSSALCTTASSRPAQASRPTRVGPRTRRAPKRR